MRQAPACFALAKEDIVVQIGPTESEAKPRSGRRFGLTDDEMLRLWRAAIKDDDQLVDAVIEGLYDDMLSFNRERAEDMIGLTIRRDRRAAYALRSLLRDLKSTAPVGEPPCG
jgi:hypothetical protein